MTYDYEWFKKAFFTETKIDLDSYKEKQMKRRIDTFITKCKVTGYDKFIDLIKKDKTVRNDFITNLTINVSEFFRNPEQWDLMDKKMFPSLIEKFGKNLKIWSAACSTGNEPYTIVMLLSRHLPLNQISVLATDIDTQAIAKAKAGVYDAKEISGIPAEFKRKYVVQDGNSYKISDEIKRRVTFKQADLLKNDYPSNYHLIICRNVLIYFTEEAKDGVFRKFYNSLTPGGILFIGSTEQIMNYKDIGFARAGSFYYERPKKEA